MFKAISSPHTHARNSTGALMRLVIYCTLPGVAVLTWFFGWGTIVQMIWATGIAVCCEAAVLALRGRPVTTTLSDFSAVLTAILLAMAIPPFAPWWVTLIGVSFSIVVAKQLYGGLGFNPFNPAMVGYVLLLISFPVQMTSWLPPIELMATSPPSFIDFLLVPMPSPLLPPQDLSANPPGFFDAIAIIFTGETLSGADIHSIRQTIDGVTAATPLDTLKTDLSQKLTAAESMEKSIFGSLAGKGWEWVNIAFLGGGLILLYKKAITWHIPVAMLATLALLSNTFYLLDSDHFASPLFQLLSGGTMLGAFFIATDPVSAATAPRARLFYGAGIGALVFIIRTWGGYPDAIAFAVLLMNMAAPTLDYYFRPRTYGHDASRPKKGEPG